MMITRQAKETIGFSTVLDLDHHHKMMLQLQTPGPHSHCKHFSTVGFPFADTFESQFDQSGNEPPNFQFESKRSILAKQPSPGQHQHGTWIFRDDEILPWRLSSS